ncbi:short chain dehydrogenase [uncultured Pontibacter sp.]|uniref:short chain dehydrogenase n=1 Tax=uncultured Pontibacter sp. TaxID=453356 RepID=UPI00262F393E|nr:short chain dehydrogenase [uncultured Pontibacter sp.]
MKIILVGATGTIGRHLQQALASKHHLITASRHNADIKLDITQPDSIWEMFETVGKFDALVSATGHGIFASLPDLRTDDFYEGIKSKLMGQINLVLIGQHYINPGGSFTLTSGILADEPIRGGTSLSMINSALHGFTMAAATELENGVRLNTISPGLVEDSVATIGASFPGHNPVPMPRVVNAYIKSLESALTGQVLKVYG